MPSARGPIPEEGVDHELLPPLATKAVPTLAQRTDRGLAVVVVPRSSFPITIVPELFIIIVPYLGDRQVEPPASLPTMRVPHW